MVWWREPTGGVRLMEKLTPEHIEEKLAELPDWSLNGEALQRTVRFDDFAGAMRFVQRIAELAERWRHYPDIMVRYDKVTLTVSTRGASALTEKDFEFARAVDADLGGS